MTSRERILKTIRGEQTDKLCISPFMHDDCIAKVVGINPNEVTVSDYIKAFKIVGCDGIICKRMTSEVDKLWEINILEEDETGRLEEHILTTPVGIVTQKIKKCNDSAPWQIEAPLKKIEDMEVLKWYIENYPKMISEENIQQLKDENEMLGDLGVISLILTNNLENTQWIDRQSLIFWFMDYPEKIKEINQLIVDSQKMTVDKAMEAGVNMFFEGIPGTEMISPQIFDEYMVPYVSQLFDYIREKNGIVHLHMCGKIMQLLDSIELLKPDLLETFCELPEGDITDLPEFYSRMNKQTCLRGNVRVERFFEESSVEDMEKDMDILFSKINPDRRFILSSSDGLMYKTSIDCLKCLTNYGQKLYKN